MALQMPGKLLNGGKLIPHTGLSVPWVLLNTNGCVFIPKLVVQQKHAIMPNICGTKICFGKSVKHSDGILRNVPENPPQLSPELVSILFSYQGLNSGKVTG